MNIQGPSAGHQRADLEVPMLSFLSSFSSTTCQYPSVNGKPDASYGVTNAIWKEIMTVVLLMLARIALALLATV